MLLLLLMLVLETLWPWPPSIFHIYIHNKPIVKTLHYAVNITSMEAELFAIRCGINQAINF